MLESLTKYVARNVLRRELVHEKKIGYKIVFRNLPHHWLNSRAIVDLTYTWRAYGLPIRGLNYFTVGAIEHGMSSRYHKKSDLYQAWLGGYVFQSKKPLTWHAERYVRLAEADQKGWLRLFGSTMPKMDFAKPEKVKSMTVAGSPAKMFAWSGITKSDTGPNPHLIVTKIMMDGMAEMMNTLTPDLRLKGKNFLPPVTFQGVHEELLISGYTIIVNIDSHTKAVLYVCMVGDNETDRETMRELITQNVKLVRA